MLSIAPAAGLSARAQWKGAPVQPLLQFVQNLGVARLVSVGVVLAAMCGLFAWIFIKVAEPRYDLLYADLDLGDSAKIVANLESGGIPYQLRNGGAAIFVPADQVAKVRIDMAGQGLPAGGPAGYELLDGASAFGATNFMQNVNLIRALEGELARTIGAIETVKGARVHVVMPKRELFSRDPQQPSASVLLQMRGARRLTDGQVVAVQHLVASAVPGLDPARISIVDGKGTLLSSGTERDGADVFAAKADERRRELESRLATTIQQLVEKTVGPGKVQAQVFAEMDFDRINTSEEVFDPDGQVVRSTQAVEESARNRASEGNLPVSVGTNLPDNEAAAGSSRGNDAAENRTEETVNYEISKKVVNHVREAGIIKRLSVAVLVDGISEPGADPSAYQPRSQQELDMIASLVRGAIGFDAKRGDTVEVINMRFVEPEVPEVVETTLILGLDRADLLHLAQYLVLGLFAILALLYVVRPVVARVLESLPVASPPSLPAAKHALLTAQTLPNGSNPALAAPGAGAAALAADGSTQGSERYIALPEQEDMIDLSQVEGRVKASSVKRVGEIVEKHPEEALAIIRNWLYAEE